MASGHFRSRVLVEQHFLNSTEEQAVAWVEQVEELLGARFPTATRQTYVEPNPPPDEIPAASEEKPENSR